MFFIKTFDQVIKHNFDQTPILLESFDQVIRSSEIRSSDPLSWAFYPKCLFLTFYIILNVNKIILDMNFMDLYVFAYMHKNMEIIPLCPPALKKFWAKNGKIRPKNSIFWKKFDPPLPKNFLRPLPPQDFWPGSCMLLI
jgi:hypothetical protein